MTLENLLQELDEQFTPPAEAGGLTVADNVTPLFKLPEITDGAEFLARTLTPPPELVHGLIHQGTKTVLGGSSKSFKTWTQMDLGITVAVGGGQKWWGRSVTQGNVLYLNFELPEFAFHWRLEFLCREKGIDPDELRGRFLVWHLRGYATDFSYLREEITKAITERGIKLVILDPYYKLLGGRDENSARDISNLHNEIERVCVDTGAAVVWGAHFAKGNASQKESIDRISGSGVFARDPDSIITLTSHEVDKAFVVEATLRSFPPVEPFVVRWKCPLMVPDKELSPADLRQSARRAARGQPTAEQFLEILPTLEEVRGDARAAMLKTAKLQQAFTVNGWDKNALSDLRDAFEGQGIIKVVTGAHNTKFVCRPEVAAAYEAGRAEN